MGALTSNRKRGDEYFSSNGKSPSLNSAYLDKRIDTHIAKKPKTSSTLLPISQRPATSKSAASIVQQYPAPMSRIKREVHAPCRVRIRFPASSNRDSAPRPSTAGFGRAGLADVITSNGVSSRYILTRNEAIGSLRFLSKDKAVIDVDAETVKDDISEDSRIEEIEVVENLNQRREINSPNLLELEGKSVGRFFQPSSSSAVVDLANDKLKVDKAGKMLDLLSLNGEVDVWVPPFHQKLLEDTKRRDGKLEDLRVLIELHEKRHTKLQLLRPVKKLEEEEVISGEPFVPLTKEEETEVLQAFSNPNRRKVLVAHENSNIEITRELLLCLGPGAWLNDEVINLYLELLKEREKREPKKFLKCHFFNTFFYKKLFSGRNDYDFKSVRRWTTQRKLGYSLLECDKIFIPIHKEVHWCLAVINKKDEKFQYLDSLGGGDTQVLKVLARYFVDEVKDKNGEQVDISSWKQEHVQDLPEQKNGFDCGMFMIKYADFYSRGLGLCFNQAHMPYFRRRTAKEILRLKAE